MDMAERFTGLLVMNTALGTGDRPLTEGFIAWRAWCAANPDMNVAKLMARACPLLRRLEEAAADGAPTPTSATRRGCAASRSRRPTVPMPAARHCRAARATGGGGMVPGRSAMVIGMTDPVLGRR